jgi:hypothetical protein
MAPVAVHGVAPQPVLSRYVSDRCPAKQRLVDPVSVRMAAVGARAKHLTSSPAR